MRGDQPVLQATWRGLIKGNIETLQGLWDQILTHIKGCCRLILLLLECRKNIILLIDNSLSFIINIYYLLEIESFIRERRSRQRGLKLPLRNRIPVCSKTLWALTFGNTFFSCFLYKIDKYYLSILYKKLKVRRWACE